MEKPTVSRRRELLYFWLRLICFAFLTVAMLAYTNYVLTPKHDYGICSMINLYRQEPDSIDVLAVGTSLTYAGVNTNVLWKEYGIAAYDLCSAEQPFWVSYYAIREALKTQHPQVILLDAKPSIYTKDYSPRGRIILSTYGIAGLANRIGAILACAETPQDALGFILGLPEVHSNYQHMSLSDFRIPPDNGGRGDAWKGFIEMDETEPHERPSLVYSSVRRNMNARQEEYVRKILELAQAEGIEVMLLGIPNPDYAHDHMYYNALWSIAEEYGISGINYNDPLLRFGLRYSSDFADWQHLNVKGSVTFSRRLGEDLIERYDLPDRRGDAHYDSYADSAAQWYAQYPMYVPEKKEGAKKP